MATALFAFFLFCLYDAAVKLGQNPPVSPFLITAIAGFTSALCLTGFAFCTRSLERLRPTRWRAQCGAAACSMIMTFFIAIALRHLPFTLFYALVFTAPLIIALISFILKEEQVTAIKIVCLVAGFSGTILAVGIHESSRDVIGYVCALIGVLGFSGRALIVRHIGKKATAQSTLLLCNVFVGFLGLAGLLFLPPQSVSAKAILCFVFAGLMTAIGSTMYFRALQNTVSTNVAQLHYMQIVFGAVFGYFLWREIPTWNRIAGSIVIVVAGVVLASQERKKNIDIPTD